MIVQFEDGSLVNAGSGKKWHVDFDNNVILTIPSETGPVEIIIYDGQSRDDAQRFLDAMAKRQQATRWNPESGEFVIQ